MSEPFAHPVFGLLAHDDGGEPVALRKFPFLPEFHRSDRDPDDEDLPLIRDWQRHLPALAPRVREFALRGGLHRAGVFEVYVEMERGESPSPAQAAAFAAFLADEQRVCRNLVDALRRYYNAARVPKSYAPYGFNFPADPDAAALAGVLEFDSLKVPRLAAGGVSPLLFSWGPAWDEEHGLLTLVYDGQVVMVGTDEVYDMMDDPNDEIFSPVWNRSVMTPAEVGAYEAYRRSRAQS